MKRLVVCFIVICLFLTALPQKNTVKAANVVNPIQVYTYWDMYSDIKKLQARYPRLISYKSIGKSAFGRELWAVKLGRGDATITINASHHAREWPTTNLTMQMIEEYAKGYYAGSKIAGLSVKQYLDDTSIWFVPMVNPDGVTLQQSGLSQFPSWSHSSLISMNGGSRNFLRWKANAQGIDLNRQYPSGWDGKDSPRYPWYMNFGGDYPLQAPEARALADFTVAINPEVAVAYHSSGRILYWHYNQTGDQYKRDYRIASVLNDITGYSLVKPNPGSGGTGYKDWFVDKFKKPGYTPEISYFVPNTNPPLSVLPEEWSRNKAVGIYLAKEGDRLWESTLDRVNWIITTFDNKPIHLRPEIAQKTTWKLTPGSYKVDATRPGWLRIPHSFYGNIWVEAKDVLGGQATPRNERMLVTQPKVLMDQPVTGKETAITLKVQPVQVVSEFGAYYGIKTDIGTKWITKDNILSNYNPIDISAYYNVLQDTQATIYPFDGSEVKRDIKKGETLYAFYAWNGWVAVKLGNTMGWIKVDGNLIYDKLLNNKAQATVLNETMLVTSDKLLYTRPYEATQTAITLRPQSVLVEAEYGNFYAIKTDIGTLWTPKVNMLRNYSPINIDVYYNVIKDTPARVYPYETSDVRGQVLTGDNVRAIYIWNNWVAVVMDNTIGWIPIDGNVLYDRVKNAK